MCAVVHAGGVGGCATLCQEGSAFINLFHMHELNESQVVDPPPGAARTPNLTHNNVTIDVWLQMRGDS